ncbi:hypothetical protein OAN61_00600 [bacterium]|nr:hypothetical protein [bacterium]
MRGTPWPATQWSGPSARSAGPCRCTAGGVWVPGRAPRPCVNTTRQPLGMRENPLLPASHSKAARKSRGGEGQLLFLE